MKWFIAVAVVGMAFSAGQAFADNFRCPNGNIVSTGYSISTVAAKCDPPAFIFRREEPVVVTEDIRVDGKARTRIIYVEAQEWTYNKGSTLLHTLIFRNGVLSEVRTGGFVE